MEQASTPMGIKESMDLLNFAEVCAAAIKKAKADGVVDWKDLLSAETRAMIPAMMEAIKDSKLVKAEMSDLDAEEINALLEKLMVVSVALVQAILA